MAKQLDERGLDYLQDCSTIRMLDVQLATLTDAEMDEINVKIQAAVDAMGKLISAYAVPTIRYHKLQLERETQALKAEAALERVGL